MRYLGGKQRIRNWIKDNVLRYKGDKTKYVEPFIGGCGSFEVCRPLFTEGVGVDIHEDLILLYQAITSGWVPPDIVTEHEYQSIRQGPPSALRGFVGFGCSFGGKWFGGYARDAIGFNYCGAGKRALLRIAGVLQLSEIRHCSYLDIDIDPSCFVYCDPPYAETTGYSTGAFDHDRFWATAEGWARLGAVVMVSEETAPPNWVCVAEKERPHSIRHATKKARTEKLWMLAP